MTKICPNCGTENQDSSEFCQNCGNKMEGTVKTSQPNKSTKTGFMGWWDKQTKGIKALSIIGVCCLGLIVIAAIGGALLPDKTTTNVSTPSSTNTTISTPATNTSTGTTFSNQYISFTKPTDLTITDNSTSNQLDVQLWKDTTIIGEISSSAFSPTDYSNTLALGSTSTTIAGKPAEEYSDSGSQGVYINLGTLKNGDKIIINIDFDPAYTTDYNLVKNSLVIKQTPPTP
jgi:hypothetical protein